MITFKAKTLEGKEVEGWYLDNYSTGSLHQAYILTKEAGSIVDPIEVKPETLRILIKDKEYTVSELEKILG